MSGDRISTGDGARMESMTCVSARPCDGTCGGAVYPGERVYGVAIGGGWSVYCAPCAEAISVPEFVVLTLDDLPPAIAARARLVGFTHKAHFTGQDGAAWGRSAEEAAATLLHCRDEARRLRRKVVTP